MNLIIIKQTKTDTKNYQFTGRSFAFFGLLIAVSTFSLAGYIGYYIAEQQQPKKYVTKWQDELNEQQKALASLESFSNTRVNVLTNRIGSMQVQLNRINALGSRLLTMANIDSKEFDFNAQVAHGSGPPSNINSKIEITELSDFIGVVEKQFASRELQLSILEELILSKHLESEILPSGQPIKKGWLSSRYGMRTDPFSGKRTMHKGVDFAGKRGSDVLTVASGVVTWAGKRYGYGQLVEINHGNGYVTRYGHNQEIVVKEGDSVLKGSVISKMGSSGRSTGPHVHFEVLKKGRQINPEKFLSNVN